MAKMDSANVQIAELTEKMNKASGSKKTEAMAALLNALVQDRLMMQGVVKMMHTHMEKSDDGRHGWHGWHGRHGWEGCLRAGLGLLQGRRRGRLRRRGSRPGSKGVAC